MEKSPTITNEERSLLLAHYQQKIEELEEQINTATFELEAARRRMQDLTINPLHNSDVEDTYSRTWPLARKAEYVLSKHEEIANTRKLAEWINIEEGGDSSEERIKNMVSALGATLKQKVDKKISFGRIESNGEISYGLLDWFVEGLFDDKPIVKPNYDIKYKKSFIIRHKNTDYESNR